VVDDPPEWFLDPRFDEPEPVATRRAARNLRLRARKRAQRAALAIVAGWTLAIAVAAVLSPPGAVSRVALFVHLSSLLVGFGPVLVLDVHGLLWLTGRRSLLEVLRLAGACDVLIWGGLLGLVASGTLLEPDLGSPLVRFKLVLVLIVALNGVFVRHIEQDVAALPEESAPADVPRGYLMRAAASATVSQLSWWGAIVIGLTSSTAA